MSAEHTPMPMSPAPFTYSGFDDHCQVGRPYHEILDADGFEVANQNGVLGERNATLFAAAPELLAALRVLIDAYGRGLPALEYRAAMEKAAAALAKAEGRGE